MIRSTTLVTMVAFCTGLLLAQAASNPNTVHYSANEVFSTTGIDPDATGRVQAAVRQQGNVNQQRLRATFSKLDPRTAYTLLASSGDDTNLIAVQNFTTSTLGRATVLYLQNGRRTGAKSTLPATVNPMTHTRVLAVANTNGQIVLSVNLSEAPSVKFELSSVFSPTGSDATAVGCFSVACQNGAVQFRLFATAQSSQFTFCVNDNPVATYFADFAGRINVGAFPNSAPSPLMFQKLCVRNAGNEPVLESQLTQ